MRRLHCRYALGIGLLVAVCATVAGAAQRALPTSRTTVAAATSVITTTLAADGDSCRVSTLLPPDATSWRVTVTTADGTAPPADAVLVGRLRGLPLVSWTITRAAGTITSTIVHDGHWSGAASAPRRHAHDFDAALGAALPGWRDPADDDTSERGDGAYVVITTQELADAVAPLLAWKRDKGLVTRLVTTAETGTANTAIRDWLRAAYRDWDVPPEYVLIVGDVDAVPAWSFSENVTDLPYALMDDDDWLPDLMVGRFPVANAQQAATVAAKSVAYERAPYRDDPDWFARQLMVGGDYGSTTPTHTVHWVGQQLQTLGFAPATEVMFPPLWNGVYPITQALEQGVGLCVYRGWAYGTAGWEPPHFTVDEIPLVDNGAMTPVVMSFVCLNGNFAADDPCFGEVFLRQGTAEQPKGAVAFIGNGEHWSHTRYNDAMAISFFETFPSPAVATLGQLMVAGKLRFMDYFPHELDAATHGEESVQFYFHIYNLLGDPELNVWKGRPGEMRVTATTPPAQARRLDVTVTEDDGTTPLPGARVGVTAADQLLGVAVTGDDGVAHVLLDDPQETPGLLVTVTSPGRFAVQRDLSPAAADRYVRVAGFPDLSAADVAPGAVLTLHPRLLNVGDQDTGPLTVTATATGPASALAGQVTLPALAAGASVETAGDDAFTLSIASDAAEGATVCLLLTAAHDGDLDRSEVELTVRAPSWRILSATAAAGGPLLPGETAVLSLLLHNAGGRDGAAGTLTAQLLTPEVASLAGGSVPLPAAAVGDTVTVTGPSLTIPATVPVGSVCSLLLHLAGGNGATAALPLNLTVGHVDAGAPAGPDRYGYRALDSADLDYPDLAPAYRWTELDTARGGAGVPVPFATDNAVVLIDLPFPFVYYGQTFSGRIRISEDGWISFDTGDDQMFYNWPIPSPHGVGALVAPFWDNFDPTLPGTGGVFTRYDADAGTFTVEWSAMRHYRPSVTDDQTFQLVLRDPAVHPTGTGDGEILFLYRQTLDTDRERQYATIGLESPDERDGLQLSYAHIVAPGTAPVGPGLAILLTTRAPVRVPYLADSFTAAPEGDAMVLSWTVSDPRPVVGWRVLRCDADGDHLVGGRLLPAAARRLRDDDAPVGGKVTYRLESVHPYGHLNLAGTATPADGNDGGLFALAPARPNPFRGRTALAFSLPRSGRTSLRIYDAAGRLVRTLLDGVTPPGPGSVLWNGRRDDGGQAAVGTYFFRLESGGRVLTRKILLVR